MAKKKVFENLEAPEIMKCIKSMYEAAAKFVKLTGMVQDEDDDEYVLENVKDYDYDFVCPDIFETVNCVLGDAGYFLQSFSPDFDKTKAVSVPYVAGASEKREASEGSSGKAEEDSTEVSKYPIGTLTKDEFFTDFGGHGNAYASFMTIGADVDALIATLNKVAPDKCIGSGKVVDKKAKAILFEICKESPELIEDICYDLKCRGFADMGAWYGEAYFTAACYDGSEKNFYTANWKESYGPERRDWDYENPDEIDDEDIEWDAFVIVKDKKTGVEFHTGDGAISYDQLDKWEDLVNHH